jgi:hypothetical protein
VNTNPTTTLSEPSTTRPLTVTSFPHPATPVPLSHEPSRRIHLLSSPLSRTLNEPSASFYIPTFIHSLLFCCPQKAGFRISLIPNVLISRPVDLQRPPFSNVPKPIDRNDRGPVLHTHARSPKGRFKRIPHINPYPQPLAATVKAETSSALSLRRQVVQPWSPYRLDRRWLQ